MNRSILIVICDFLLVSLLAFSTVDVNKVADQGTPRQANLNLATNQVDSRQDLAAVMRLALNQERQGNQQLLGELTKTRAALGQQQTLATEREHEVQTIQQELQAKEQQAAQLLQQQTNLQQQHLDLEKRLTSAQSNIQDLNQRLQTNAAQAKAQASLSKEQLAAMDAEIKKRNAEALALQHLIDQLARSNQMVLNERQQLASQLRVAEVEKRSAAEQAARMQEEVKVERAEKERLAKNTEKLAEGVTVLATKSGELAEEIRENRALAPNTIFSQFLTNRVQVAFIGIRPGLFGGESTRRKESQTVLVTDRTNTFALCHVQDTPLMLSSPGEEWSGLTATLSRNQTVLPIQSLCFYHADPRVVVMPITQAEALQLGCKVYNTSTDPFKFQDAVVVGASEGYYGECKFQIDLSTPDYVKMDHNSIKGLFGKFNPSRGDLVFSRTGELVGVMANSTYCMLIRDFGASAIFELAEDVRTQHTGKTLSQLYARIFSMPAKLQ
jgi:hypothetical protein